MIKKIAWITFFGLLILLLSADFVMVQQEEQQKEPPVEEIVNAPIEQLPLEFQALVDQLKYYKSIGDLEKQMEILEKLKPFIPYEPEMYETEEKPPDVVLDAMGLEDDSPDVSAQWLGSDQWVMWANAHEKAPSIEAAMMHGTNDPNVSIAAEIWSGSSPNNIKLKRSNDHGTTWGWTKYVTSSKQLRVPKIRQIANDYYGVVYQRNYSSSDYDVMFAKVKWDHSTVSTHSIDTSGGTKHHRPAIASDYEDDHVNPWIFVAYWDDDNRLLFRRSTNGGISWSSAVVIDNPTWDVDYPHCSIDWENGKLYVAYTTSVLHFPITFEEDVMVAMSSNYGASWTKVKVANANKDERYPSVAAKYNTVIVSYEYRYSSSDMDVRYAYSMNKGVSWVKNKILSSSSANDEWKPFVRSFDNVSTYIWAGFTETPTNDIELRRLAYNAPQSPVNYGNKKSSGLSVSASDILGLVPKQTPTGSSYGVIACWPEYRDSYYGWDIRSDAYWLPCTPGTFSYVTPANGATNVPLTAYLDWSTSSGAASYDVYFGTSTSPPKVATTTSSFYNPPGYMTPGAHYYWRIVARNTCGTRTGSLYHFYTTCPLPTIPYNPSPANGATGVALTAVLDWNDSGGATSYDVYLGTTSSPPKVATVTSSTYDPPGNLNIATSYNWKIVAKNSCGSTPGPVWSFSTGGVPPVGAKVAYLKGSGTNYQLRVYTAPTSVPELGTLVGTDYWTCDGPTVAITNIDVNGDGTDEIAFLKGSGTNFQLRVYTMPTSVGDKGTLIGTDYWTCDGPTVGMTNVDVNGDGTDEIAYLKGSGTDFQVRVYTAPTSVGHLGTLIGTDYWSCDGNTVGITNVDVNGDGTDEIAYLKGSGTDYQVRVYTAPTSVGYHGILIGTDYWTCDGSTVGITNVDVNGDGTDEIAYLKGSGTNFQVRVYTAPTSVGYHGILIGTDYWTCDGPTKAFTGAK